MNGLIVRVYGRFYTVRHEGGEVNSVLRGKLKINEQLKNFSSPVAVGDSVEFHINDEGLGVIESINPGRNHFSRKDRIKGKEDLIASNLDMVVVVQSFAQPKYNLRFVDRLLVRGVSENIPVLLCVNKIDLAEKEDIDFINSYYKNTGINIVFTSVKENKGIDEFKGFLARGRSLLVGYSGVGKSSLLNTIFPTLNLKTNEVSESTGKGKHTTTNVRLEFVDEHTELIDTPGVREFGLMDIEPERLGAYFEDFAAHADGCRFRPCTHDHEPGCVVKQLVEDGVIHRERYISYLNILYSLRENYDNMYS